MLPTGRSSHRASGWCDAYGDYRKFLDLDSTGAYWFDEHLKSLLDAVRFGVAKDHPKTRWDATSVTPTPYPRKGTIFRSSG